MCWKSVIKSVTKAMDKITSDKKCYQRNEGCSSVNSYVKYSMHGFNCQHSVDKDKKEWEVTLQDNHEYIYENHPFLYSVFIDDHLQSITFRLRPGAKCQEHLKEISLELEKICFNLICYSLELPIGIPFCELELIVDEDGQDCTMKFKERLKLHDKAVAIKQISGNSIYEAAFNNKNVIESRTSQYKELFYILFNPYKVIQFIGLYDIMADLIYNSEKNVGISHSQNMIRDFFVKYESNYMGRVTVKDSKFKDKKGVEKVIKEDSLTQIRNQIAHSKDRGIKEFLEVSERISFRHIQTLLMVINDLLCGTVVP